MKKLADIGAFEALSNFGGSCMSGIDVFNARAMSDRIRMKNGDSAILRAEYKNGKVTAEMRVNDMKEWITAPDIGVNRMSNIKLKEDTDEELAKALNAAATRNEGWRPGWSEEF